MKELTLSELKSILLKILLFIDKFCRENDINYSLDGGTLLGAVRHKGFIPWDDDIDIMMPRPDYDKFVSLFVDNSNNYKLLCYEREKKFEFAFAKLSDTRTVLFEYGLDTLYGINIDIFSIDGFDLHKNIYIHKQFYRIIQKAMVFKKYGIRLSGNNTKKLYDSIVKIFLKPIPMFFLGFLCQTLLKADDFTTSHYGCLLSGFHPEKQIYPISLFNNYIDIEFEGYLFRSVRDFDLYLSNLYGDYMTLPPKDEQVSKHTAIGFMK
jgi:lipopolysaccharide cholinephosphotransferase